ncbi:MAG: 50S ribosomal protein L4 [Gemmatimonadota bacterium]|nr:50S ribosomal protein L4 [Gemmatimonadota bacterium]
MADTESTEQEVTARTAAAYTAGGTARDAVTLPTDLFDGTINFPVMHHAVKAYLANQRQGNASTKTRGFVIGGNQKPWKQKGTGRARQGSTRAPHWVGGGTVFGPSPRDYTMGTNKKVKILARKSALNARASEDSLFVIDRFDYDAPKTAQLAGLLESLGVSGRKILILTDGVNRNVYLSCRNLPTAHVMPFADASTYHILWSDVVLVESGAIGESLAPVAEGDKPARTPSHKPVHKSAHKVAKKAATAKKSAAKKKTAAKKTASGKTTAKKTSAKKSSAKKSTAKKSSARKSTTKKSSAKKRK